MSKLFAGLSFSCSRQVSDPASVDDEKSSWCKHRHGSTSTSRFAALPMTALLRLPHAFVSHMSTYEPAVMMRMMMIMMMMMMTMMMIMMMIMTFFCHEYFIHPCWTHPTVRPGGLRGTQGGPGYPGSSWLLLAPPGSPWLLLAPPVMNFESS